MKTTLMIIGTILLLPVLLLAALLGGWIWTTDRQGAKADIAS